MRLGQFFRAIFGASKPEAASTALMNHSIGDWAEGKPLARNDLLRRALVAADAAEALEPIVEAPAFVVEIAPVEAVEAASIEKAKPAKKPAVKKAAAPKKRKAPAKAAVAEVAAAVAEAAKDDLDVEAEDVSIETVLPAAVVAEESAIADEGWRADPMH